MYEMPISTLERNLSHTITAETDVDGPFTVRRSALECAVNVEPDSDENPLDRDNLPFPTDHLPSYAAVNRAAALQGEEYVPVKKALWYQVVSMPMRQVIVEQGDAYNDLRVHMAIPLPSGGGKKNIIHVLMQLFREHRGRKAVKPTSYHPEQLVGKTVKHGRKDPTYEEVPGHLAEDLVVIDEAIDLFRSSQEKYRESRNYLNEALDPYGQNRITKRMTNLPRDKALSYQPDCNTALFFQPFAVGEEVLLQGTIRRFLIPYADFSPQMQLDGYEDRLREDNDRTRHEAIEELSQFLDQIESHVEGIDRVTVASSAVDTLVRCHRELVYQGFAHSDKGKNYMRIVDYGLQDRLLKFAGIQAIVHGRDEIMEPDIEQAYVDLADLFACNLEYVYDKVLGKLDYGDDWDGARKEDQRCLEWLENQGAMSKEASDTAINEYWEAICHICDVKEDAARKRYSKHKENGWIDSDQVGRHDTRVWLTVDRSDDENPRTVRDVRRNALSDPLYFDILPRL